MMKSDEGVGGASEHAELLAQTAWVRGLARGLVADPNDADDLAQDACLAALRRPGLIIGGAQGVRAFLAGTLRNIVRHRGRSEARARERERAVAADERVPSAADCVVQVSQIRLVVDAVLELEEPYRSTVLMRYFEGLTPAEIAARQGLPAGTVRTRLSRGLTKLRERLDQVSGGDRQVWMSGLVPLVGVKFGAPTATSGAGMLGKEVLEKLVMGTAAKVCGGIVLTVGAAWWISGWEEQGRQAPVLEGPLGPVTPSQVEPAGGGEDRVLAIGAGVRSVADERTLITPPEDPLVDEAIERPGWSVLGSVHGLQESALAKVTIRVSELRVNTPSPPISVGGINITDEDGVFDLDVSSIMTSIHVATARGLLLTVDHPRYAPFELRLPVDARHRPGIALDELDEAVTWRVDIKLLSAAIVTGQVVFESGEPATGASVVAVDLDGPSGKVEQGLAICDQDGEFVLRLSNEGDIQVYARGHSLRPAAQEGHVKLGTDFRFPVPFVLREGHTIAGRVEWRGAPQPKARLEVILQAPYSGTVGSTEDPWPDPFLANMDGAFERSRFSVTCDEGGRFLVKGLGPFPYSIQLIAIPGVINVECLPRAPEPVFAPREDLVLTPNGAIIRLTTSEALAPSKNGLLTISYGAVTPPRDVPILWHEGIPAFAWEANAPVDVEVNIEGMSPWSQTLITPNIGEELAHEITLAPGASPASLLVRVQASSSAHPIGYVCLEFFYRDAEDRRHPKFVLRSEVTDGVARFGPVVPGDYRVVAYSDLSPGANPANYYVDIEIDLRIDPGREHDQVLDFELGGRLQLIVPGELMAPMHRHLTITNSRDEPVSVKFFDFGPGSTTHLGSRHTPTSEAFPSLPPGTYQVKLFDGVALRGSFAVEIEAGATTKLTATLDD